MDPVTIFHGDEARVPGTEVRLPIRFPTRRTRGILVVLRGIVFVVALAAVLLLANHPIERYGVAVTESGFPSWVLALFWWGIICVMVVFDGNRLIATREGIRIRARLRTRWLPWHAISAIVTTGAGLGFVLGGKTAEIYDFVDRRARSRIVMRVSPMDALAADLESVRRALSTSGWTNHSEQPSRRLFVFSGAEWAQILGMGVLLLVAAVVAA